HAGAAGEVAREVAREGDVMADERPVQPAQPLIAAAAAVEVADVAPVLAVHAHRYAREPRRHGHFERREVARVHHRRPQPAQLAPCMEGTSCVDVTSLKAPPLTSFRPRSSTVSAAYSRCATAATIASARGRSLHGSSLMPYSCTASSGSACGSVTQTSTP